MRALVGVKDPLVLFYQAKVQEAGFHPVDVATAKKSFAVLKDKYSSEELKKRLSVICKYLHDISANFPRYRYSIPVEIVIDNAVWEFLKERARTRHIVYEVKYDPMLLPWALDVVRRGSVVDVEEKVKEVGNEAVRGAILKAYEMLGRRGDYFLNKVLSICGRSKASP